MLKLAISQMWVNSRNVLLTCYKVIVSPLIEKLEPEKSEGNRFVRAGEKMFFCVYESFGDKSDCVAVGGRESSGGAVGILRWICLDVKGMYVARRPGIDNDATSIGQDGEDHDHPKEMRDRREGPIARVYSNSSECERRKQKSPGQRALHSPNSFLLTPTSHAYRTFDRKTQALD